MECDVCGVQVPADWEVKGWSANGAPLCEEHAPVEVRLAAALAEVEFWKRMYRMGYGEGFAEYADVVARAEKAEAEVEANRADAEACARLMVENCDLQARAEKAESRAARLEAALRQLMRYPHGCPACHSGTLIHKDKEHWNDCPYLSAQKALEE